MEPSEVPDLIRWDGTIQLGIRTTDTQHRRLVERINTLDRAMKLRKGREAMLSVFIELVDYTKQHFGDEERLMRQHNYEGLAEQEAQHKHFVKNLIERQQQVKNGNAMVTMDLMDVLNTWLIKHIMGTDSNYSNFFRDRGVA